MRFVTVKGYEICPSCDAAPWRWDYETQTCACGFDGTIIPTKEDIESDNYSSLNVEFMRATIEALELKLEVTIRLMNTRTTGVKTMDNLTQCTTLCCPNAHECARKSKYDGDKAQAQFAFVLSEGKCICEGFTPISSVDEQKGTRSAEAEAYARGLRHGRENLQQKIRELIGINQTGFPWEN